MTTPAAARMYEAQHLYAMEGKRNVVYNPLGKPLEDLPHIMCFNNGGSPGWLEAIAVSEDGYSLGGHICSSEAYMQYDLGVLENTRLDRHEKDYSKHYPDGYIMEWIPSAKIDGHEKLQKTMREAQERETKEKEKTDT